MGRPSRRLHGDQPASQPAKRVIYIAAEPADSRAYGEVYYVTLSALEGAAACFCWGSRLFRVCLFTPLSTATRLSCRQAGGVPSIDASEDFGVEYAAHESLKSLQLPPSNRQEMGLFKGYSQMQRGLTWLARSPPSLAARAPLHAGGSNLTMGSLSPLGSIRPSPIFLRRITTVRSAKADLLWGRKCPRRSHQRWR